jgi:hypothetical protein
VVAHLPSLLQLGLFETLSNHLFFLPICKWRPPLASWEIPSFDGPVLACIICGTDLAEAMQPDKAVRLPVRATRSPSWFTLPILVCLFGHAPQCTERGPWRRTWRTKWRHGSSRARRLNFNVHYYGVLVHLFLCLSITRLASEIVTGKSIPCDHALRKQDNENVITGYSTEYYILLTFTLPLGLCWHRPISQNKADGNAGNPNIVKNDVDGEKRFNLMTRHTTDSSWIRFKSSQVPVPLKLCQRFEPRWAH